MYPKIISSPSIELSSLKTSVLKNNAKNGITKAKLIKKPLSRTKKLEKIVKDIYAQLDDIKAMYHLSEKDLETIWYVEPNLIFEYTPYLSSYLS